MQNVGLYEKKGAGVGVEFETAAQWRGMMGECRHKPNDIILWPESKSFFSFSLGQWPPNKGWLPPPDPLQPGYRWWINPESWVRYSKRCMVAVWAVLDWLCVEMGRASKRKPLMCEAPHAGLIACFCACSFSKKRLTVSFLAFPLPLPLSAPE